MAPALAALLDAPLPPGTKGLPDLPDGFTLGDIAGRGWSLLDDTLPLPVAVIHRPRIERNIAEMQGFADRAGVRLAPHGKTTLCPQLFERQLAAGAWGITVASVAQARLCRAPGVERVLIANEIAGRPEARMLARLCAEAPDCPHLVLVDSIAGADLLQQAFEEAPDAPPCPVLIEFGFRGGRCGVRTIADAVGLARALGERDRLRLAGIEGYEGLVVTDDAAADARWVRAYLADLVEALRRIRDMGCFAGAARPILSAGGSVYYDLVAALGDAQLGGAVEIVLRSGCYLTQDTGFYARAMGKVAARAGDDAPHLANALEIWARVLSAPEPGRVILSAGKRDLSYDIDLPQPIGWFRHGAHRRPQPLTGRRIAQLSDQHAFLDRTAEADAAALAVGDCVLLGVSHPCTTFDKWDVLLEVDDDYRVVGGLKTFF